MTTEKAPTMTLRAWFEPSDSKGHVGHLWEKPTEWQLERGNGYWVTITPEDDDA